MKKLLSIFMAAAMLFGLASCSGDLHDMEDPNAMAGYWSYRVIDLAGDTSVNLITQKDGVGQSGAFGSPDFTVDVSSGTAAIIWNGVDKSDLTLSARSDTPTLSSLGVTLGTNEVCIFVFTPLSSVNLYAYPVDDGNFVADDWPGVATIATATVETWSLTVDKIEIVNCPTIEAAGYIAICSGWIPDNEWGETTPNKIVDEENAVLTLTSAYVAEAEGEADISLDVQILNPADDASFWNDESKISNGGSVSATATKAAFEGKTVKFVVTFTDATTCTAAFVEE